MRLLAKSAEDRYQTAAGLEADLQQMPGGMEAHGRIEPFPLGTRDVSDRLLLPERLYGREREIETLWRRSTASSRMARRSSYWSPAIPASANPRWSTSCTRRSFRRAGCSRPASSISTSAISRTPPWRRPFRVWSAISWARGEVELGEWRDALREALGANGGLIVNLVPELELVIGKQPPVADLPPQDAKNRFQSVFRRFLGVFARKEHPLALFLDDLQWLDTATLELSSNW